MNELLKAFLKKQVVKKLVTTAAKKQEEKAKKEPEKKAKQEPEKAEDKNLDKMLLGAAVGVAVGAFLAVCAVKSLQALRQANEEKAAREQKQLEAAPAEEPEEEKTAETE